MFETQQILHDRYQLVHLLGETAGRQTWLANDLTQTPPLPVIVKLLAFAQQTNWDPIKLFEREAKVLQHLHHPQIPQYRDSFSIEDHALWFVLVQEFIAGTTLKDLLVQGERFSEQRICQIATEVLQILIYLHELKPPVFHRDIKPSNLIWGEDEYIYLIDFGAVQDKAAVEGVSFTVVGTYGYAPLEQFGGRTVPSSDLYALGATLIHLATGVAPANLPQRQFRIQFADKTTLRSEFVSWLEKLVEPDVGYRFSKARMALASLEMVMQASASSLHPLPIVRSEPSSPLVLSQSSDRSEEEQAIYAVLLIFFLAVIIEFGLLLSPLTFLQNNQNQTSSTRQLNSTSKTGQTNMPTWNRRSVCLQVDARSGWQRFTFPFSVSTVSSISKGWSVDRQRYGLVGAGGHIGKDAEALTPYISFKYDQRYPFGALLIGVPSEAYGYQWVSQSQLLVNPTSQLSMRINDSDSSLGDNRGALQVCFEE